VATQPAVALIHGFASSFDHGWARHGWPELLADDGHAVIGVELLGHGSSARPHDPEAYRDLEAHALAQLPDGEAIDAIGFSLGATTLLRLAIAHPQRFRRIVLMGIGDRIFQDRSGDPATTVSALEAPDGPPLEDTFGTTIRRMADTERNDREALVALLRRPTEVIDIETLTRVTATALIIIGDEDRAYPATQLQAALAQSQLLVIHGRDHFATPSDFRAIEAALAFVSQ
jgi:pimeloyl-ACP methyl ester carboxylesterase